MTLVHTYNRVDLCGEHAAKSLIYKDLAISRADWTPFPPLYMPEYLHQVFNGYGPKGYDIMAQTYRYKALETFVIV